MARGAGKEKSVEFGQRLRVLRKEHGHSQQEVAERLNISRSAYTYYETGKTSPDVFMLVEIADFYGISKAELFQRLLG